MSNVEKLEEGGVLDTSHELTPEQAEAIESLSEQDVADLVAKKKKAADVFPPNTFTLINTHHMPEG